MTSSKEHPISNNPQDLISKTGIFTGLHSGMGIAAKAMVVVFVVFTALNVEFANSIYSSVRGWIEHTLNWYYISSMMVMLLVCFYLMFSRFGHIKLGDDDSKPEFSNFSWFSIAVFCRCRYWATLFRYRRTHVLFR